MLLASARDWAIIILAGLSAILTILLIALTLVLLRLAIKLRGKLLPILDSARTTMGTVQGTSTFVSDTVVKPVITVLSVLSGIRRTLSILSRLSGRKKRR